MIASKDHPDNQIVTVVDITYLCNAACKYCRWGNSLTVGRVHRPLKEILLPEETLKALGTQKLVLSGGEPRLHPDLEFILRYYRELVDNVTVITNGYSLNAKEASRLLRAGATGITVSLDSAFPDEAIRTRATPPSLHAQILSNLQEIADLPRTFELGINSVVSHVTANWRTVKALLEVGNRLRVDFVKFQPVFDDGYLKRNAPELMLAPSDLPALLEIASNLDTIVHPRTNSPAFWTDIVALVYGESLPSEACGLGPRQAISIKGRLGICFWVDSVSYGRSSHPISKDDVAMALQKFEGEKLRCNVGFHCFCTQNLSHRWKGTSI